MTLPTLARKTLRLDHQLRNRPCRSKQAFDHRRGHV